MDNFVMCPRNSAPRNSAPGIRPRNSARMTFIADYQRIPGLRTEDWLVTMTEKNLIPPRTLQGFRDLPA